MLLPPGLPPPPTPSIRRIIRTMPTFAVRTSERNYPKLGRKLTAANSEGGTRRETCAASGVYYSRKRVIQCSFIERRGSPLPSFLALLPPPPQIPSSSQRRSFFLDEIFRASSGLLIPMLAKSSGGISLDVASSNAGLCTASDTAVTSA